MKLTWKERLASILKIIGMIVAILLIAVAIIFSIWRASFVSWTGFGDFTTPTGEFIRGKTVWDWMQLLVIPLSLLIAGYFLNRSERDIERRRTEDRANLEREIATDRQQEAALQAYLDRMTDLLLKEKLRITENEEVCEVARIRTLTVLRGLDENRKGLLIRFLYDAKLIDSEKPIVDLTGADCSFANLFCAHLEGANLKGVNFMNANLLGAYLQGANLKSAIITGSLVGARLEDANMEIINLTGCNLSGANLRRVNLRNGMLIETNLEDAFLQNASLESAFLADANLKGAHISSEQLATVSSLKGAIMPDGTKHD